MFTLIRSTRHIWKVHSGARCLTVKCIADLNLTIEKSRRVMESLNNASLTELEYLPVITHKLAKSLEDHKDKFGRITMHTTWTKITGLDLEQMKELCMVLSENKDGLNSTTDADTGIEDEDEEVKVNMNHAKEPAKSPSTPQFITKLDDEEEGEVKVNARQAKESPMPPSSPQFITNLDNEDVIDNPVSQSVPASEPQKLITNIKTEQEDENKLLEYSLGLNLIVPSIKSTTLPSSVVAVSIETAAIAWCSMTSDLQVHSWELRPILSTQGGKNTFPQIYDEFTSFYSAMHLPTEDGVFVTEESGSRIPVFRARHEAIFFTLCAERQAAARRESGAVRDLHPFSNHVYRLKPSVVVNLFGLEVGGQRVSCNTTVLDMKKDRCPPAAGVRVPDMLYSQWFRLRRYDQHIAGNALLTAVAFYNKLRASAKTDKPVKKESQSRLSAEL